MSYDNGRPKIPEPMKREVRKRCGFGCVLCGIPLVQYHHMEPWAAVERHEAHNLTLLCGRHHDEVTRKLLPDSVVAKANKNPLNVVNGESSAYMLHYAGEAAEVQLGSVKFHAAPRQDIHVLRIFGETLLGFHFDDGDYALNVKLDRMDGSPAVRITNNELVFVTDAWDVSLVANRLVIKDESHRVYLDVRFFTPSIFRVEHAIFWHRGHYIYVHGNLLQYQTALVPQGTGPVVMNGVMKNVPGGINIYDPAVGDDIGCAIGYRSTPLSDEQRQALSAEFHFLDSKMVPPELPASIAGFSEATRFEYGKPKSV